MTEITVIRVIVCTAWRHAEHAVYCGNSICHLWHVCFVAKQLNISLKFFHYLIGPSF